MNARATAAVRLLAGDKEPVRLASTANLSLSGLLTVDGVATAPSDRILVKDQTDATQNGIYTASEGVWYRAPDFASSRSMIAATKVAVQEGAAHAGDVWSLDTNRPNLGDDDIEFSLYLNTAIADEINAARETLVAEMDAIIAAAMGAGKATQAEAEAGVSNVGWMTPLRTDQHFDVAYAAAYTASNLGNRTFNIRDFGAVGDGTTDDSSVFASAVSAMGAFGGGKLHVPPGVYRVDSGITLSTNVLLVGAGRVSTWLYRPNDGTVLTLDDTGQNGAEHLGIMGYGNGALDLLFGETTFAGSATADVVIMNAHGGVLRDIQIQGGRHALTITCQDALITNVDCSNSYGSSNVFTNGANWHYHCKWDNTSGIPEANTRPYSNWAPSTAYTVGQIRINNGFLMSCATAGTSGAVAPALRNYGFAMTDGAATWRLLSPETYYGLYIQGSGENHFHQIDLSGSGSYAASLIVGSTPAAAPAVTIFESSIFSDNVIAVDGDWLEITNCEVAGAIILSLGYSGRATIANNWSNATLNISVGANVNGFIITNNQMCGGAITVAPGTSNRYQIAHNNEVTVTDGGTGVNKSVSGNS